MGIKIIDQISTSCGSSHVDTYATISGIYKIERRADNYYICSSANIYLSKSTYSEKKIPIVFHLRVELETNINILQNEDLYRLLYDRLKTVIQGQFGNHITFEDDL